MFLMCVSFIDIYNFVYMYKFIYKYRIRSISILISFITELIRRDWDKKTVREYHPQKETNVKTFSKEKPRASAHGRREGTQRIEFRFVVGQWCTDY